MGYKRPVRILFIDADGCGGSQIAADHALELGGGLTVARSASLVVHTNDPRVLILNGELLSWADLVITLGDSCGQNWPRVDPPAQTRHWPLPRLPSPFAAEDEIDRTRRAVRDEIHRRVAGLIGGIRLWDRQARP